MARGVNKVILVGNLGADPELRATTSGVRVAKFSVATNESWVDKSGTRQDATEWHRITAWDKLADVAEKWLHKGDRVYIEGKIKTSKYEKDGETRYSTEIVCKEMVMLGSPDGADTRTSTAKPAAADRDDYEEFSNRNLPPEDDLPF